MPSIASILSPFRRRLALLLAAAITLHAVDSSNAANPRYVIPAVDRTESRAAHEELVQARRAYTRARVAHLQAKRQATILRVDRPLPRISTEPDPILARLESELAIATSHYNELRRPLLSAVQTKADYVAWFHARNDLRRAIDLLIRSGKSNEDARIGLANRALDISSRMTRAESLALTLDRGVEDARLMMAEASRRMRQHIDARHVASGMPSRMDPLGAPPPSAAEVDEARARVEAADRRLADALLREAAMEQVRAMRLNHQRMGRSASLFGN